MQIKLQEYSKFGYRTLVFGIKALKEEAFNDWYPNYVSAINTVSERDIVYQRIYL